MSKKLLIVLIVLPVLIITGLIIGQKNQSTKQTAEIDTAKILEASEASGNIADHVAGKRNAKMVIVQYSDYSCVHCAEHGPRIHKFIADSDLDVALVYRHFPITQYPNSKAAAAAAEAAGKQNKFWEMSDLLYQNQISWSKQTSGRDQIFEDYAKQLGLNIDQYKADYASDEVATKINFNKTLGEKDKLTGTPAFYYQGELIDSSNWATNAKLDEFIKSKIK